MDRSKQSSRKAVPEDFLSFWKQMDKLERTVNFQFSLVPYPRKILE